jgi:hypothetical protein
MTRHLHILVLGFFVFTACSLAGQSAETPHQVVARVSGTELTLGDLQHNEGGKLLQAQYQFYLSERKALEELIDNRLLADEASRKAIPLEQLLETEVYKDVKDPTEDQLEVYYEGLDTHRCVGMCCSIFETCGGPRRVPPMSKISAGSQRSIFS